MVDMTAALGLLQCMVVLGLPVFGLLCAMDVRERQIETRRKLRKHIKHS